MATDQLAGVKAPGGLSLSGILVLLAVALGLVGLFLTALFVGAPENSRLANASATIAIVTAAAVGIERLIEVGWALVGLTGKGQWPFDLARSEIQSATTFIRLQVRPYIRSARQLADTLATDSNKKNQAQIRHAASALEKHLKSLERGVSDSDRASAIIAAFQNSLTRLDSVYKAEEHAGTVALIHSAASDLSDFLVSITDNPGRKIISIFVGSILGLAVAIILRLDLFAAILKGVAHTPYFGIAITGVAIGLGATPTHELIKGIKSYKKSRNADVRHRDTPPFSGVSGSGFKFTLEKGPGVKPSSSGRPL